MVQETATKRKERKEQVLRKEPKKMNFKFNEQMKSTLSVLTLSVLLGLLLGIAIVSVTRKVIDRYNHSEFQVLDRVNRNDKSFTQGFAIDGNWVYESSGGYGRSYIEKYDKYNSINKIRRNLPPEVFAEGLTVVDDLLYVLTWKSQQAYIYDKEDLRLIRTLNYDGEGWGITYDGVNLIISDGSDTIKYVDKDTFKTVRTINVRKNRKSVRNLNELEYYNGYLFANQWRTNLLFVIEPRAGKVLTSINLKDLQKESASSSKESVANGVAIDFNENKLWLTGKEWKYRYQIRTTINGYSRSISF